MAENTKGLAGVVAGQTTIATVGKEGVGLTYRGYAIEDLCEHASFEEVAYLLLHGELPNASQLDAYKKDILGKQGLPGGLKTTLEQIPASAHPMDVLRTAVSMLGLYDKRAKIGEPDHEANREVAISLCAQVGTIVAYYHRARQGLDLPPVREDLSEAGHFIYLSTGEEPGEQATLFVADPSGNALEFKAFRNPESLFATGAG